MYIGQPFSGVFAEGTLKRRIIRSNPLPLFPALSSLGDPQVLPAPERLDRPVTFLARLSAGWMVRLVIHRMSNSNVAAGRFSAATFVHHLVCLAERRDFSAHLAGRMELVVFAISLCDVCPASFPTLLNYQEDDGET